MSNVSYKKVIDDLKFVYSENNTEFKHDYDKKLINIISSSLEKGFDNNYQRIWSTNYTDKNDLDKLFIEFYNEAKDK